MSASGEITAVRCGHCGTPVARTQRQCHSCGHVIQASNRPEEAGPAPTDFGAFSGPRVHAQRGQSADAGGGVLSVFAGWVQIQGAVRSRQLGPMQDLRSVMFRDRQGREATLTFGDGTAWRLEGGAGGELLTFMLEVEKRMAVPGLVQQPPPISDEIASAMTPDVKRNVGGVVAACAFAWLLTVLTRMWSPLGYVLFAVVVLGIAAFFMGRELIGPKALRRWTGWCEDSPIIASALAVALVIGALIGMNQASDDRALAAVAQAEQAKAAALLQSEANAKAAARNAELSKLPGLIATMNGAVTRKAWREAKAAHDMIVTIDEKSATASAVLPMIEQGLSAQAEAERRKALVAAVAAIPRVAKDKVQCESAATVASLWQGLSGVTAADPEYDAAIKLVPKLEACRRRVVSTFAGNAVDTRLLLRASSARALERGLRDSGEDVTIELAGEGNETLKIVRPGINEAWVERITENGARNEGSFLKQWQDQGARAVELGDGRRVLRTYRLKPDKASDVSRQVLVRFGLSEPLALPSQVVTTPSQN